MIDYSKYNKEFYTFNTTFLDDARFLVPFVYNIIHPKTVVDVGCGSGTWLSVFKSEFKCDILGIDGDYVDLSKSFLSNEEFVPANLEEHFSLESCHRSEMFDLAVSLEVAEHLSPSRADSFIKDLTELSDAVLFSAAIPGVGGTNHVNERPIGYWVNKFRNHHFVPINCIRPMFRSVRTYL